MELELKKWHPEEKKECYPILTSLGEGAFGEVKLAIFPCTGEYVAIKNVRVSSSLKKIPRAVFREVESLRQLSCSTCIVRLLEVFPDDTNLCIVMEYLPSDLSEVLSQTKEAIPCSQIKSYARMLAEALYFCHSHHIIHRDVKPSNILLSSSGLLKLGDFGLARILSPPPASNAQIDDNGTAVRGENGMEVSDLNTTAKPDDGRAPLSYQVATRWYRAPELLFASRFYDYSIDMWAAGAVIAELFTLSPLFPGNNDIDQIFRVFQIMGTATKENWPDADSLPDFHKVNFPEMSPADLHIVIPRASRDDIAFLKTMLSLNPSARHTAAQVLQNGYFGRMPLPQLAVLLPRPLREKMREFHALPIELQGVRELKKAPKADPKDVSWLYEKKDRFLGV